MINVMISYMWCFLNILPKCCDIVRNILTVDRKYLYRIFGRYLDLLACFIGLSVLDALYGDLLDLIDLENGAAYFIIHP